MFNIMSIAVIMSQGYRLDLHYRSLYSSSVKTTSVNLGFDIRYKEEPNAFQSKVKYYLLCF